MLGEERERVFYDGGILRKIVWRNTGIRYFNRLVYLGFMVCEGVIYKIFGEGSWYWYWCLII